MAGRRTDTRSKIRATAMELFSSQGYEKTSIRQIAEQLGITKAAVYYHFRSKEEIVASLSDDLRAGVDDILKWASSQPGSRRTGTEILRRYSAVLHTTGRDMTRFMHDNAAAFRGLNVGVDLRYQFQAVSAAMTAPKHHPLEVFHARQALLAIGWSVAMMGDLDLTDEECHAAAIEVARAIYSCS